MKKSIRRGIQCVLLMAHISAFGYSNPIEGGSAETVTNLWNVPLPWLIVGGNSESNSLVISDGGQVNNAIGYIGNAVTSTDNSALVTGDGSVWNNSLELSVGYLGASNRLTVAAGGTVVTPNAYIGNNSDGNAIIVTGSNSLLDAANLNVGYQGSSNSLLVTDGGTAESEVGTIGYWISSDGNIATVQSNGTWNSSTQLNIGEYGSGNQLVVGAGGRVGSPGVNVGVQSISSNNTVMVTGENAWMDAHELYIGGSAAGAGGTGNRVEVESGGTVYTESLNIYSNSAFDLNDGGRLFANTNFNASMENFNWNAGGTLEVGGELTWMGSSIVDQRVLVLNGPAARWEVSAPFTGFGVATEGSALVVTNGGYVSSRHRFEVIGGSVVVSGLGSTLYQPNFTSSADVVFGPSLQIKNGGMLMVEDGGLVSTRELEIGGRTGRDRTTSDNLILVSGSDSVLEVRGGPPDGPDGGAGFIGIYGDDNELRLEDGGQVLLNGDCLVYGDSNALMVTGAGSVWSNSGALVFGDATYDIPRYDPTGNSMTVSNSGTVYNESSYIGYSAGADSNSALVTGRGSVWDNTSQLYVGYNGSGNTLRIEDGGYVHAQWGSSIGYGESANGNHVVVTGENSVWGSGWGGARLIEAQPPIVFPPPIDWPPILAPFPTNYPPFEIWPGITNELPVLTNYLVNPEPPYVVYSGNGSVWTVGGELGLGNTLSNNLILVTNGVSVVGGEEANNQLTVSSGGFVGSGGGSVLISTSMATAEFATDSSIIGSDLTNGVVHQSVLIDGPVIVISNEVSIATNYITFQPVTAIRMYARMGDLAVGRGGSDNVLEISDGALVANYHGIVGEMSNAWNNAVSVVGTNSEWRNAGDLYIGGRMSQVSYWINDEWFTPWVNGGRGNSLYIADGGLVSVGSDMHNRNYSMLYLDPGGLVSIGGDYYQDDTAMLRFGVETNAAGAPINALMTVGGTAEFEEGAQIEYASNVGELLFDRFYTNKLIEADALVIAGISNPDSLDLELLDASGSLVDVIFWENDQDIYALAGRRYLAESAGFDEDSMMGRLSKEIDDMSLLGNSDAMRMIDLLNTMSGSEQNEQLVQEYAYSTPSYLHIQGMTEGLGKLTKHTSRRPAAAPDGASGPHSADQGARGWIRPYGSWSERTAHDGFAGYDHNVYGTLVGMDWIQSNVLLGVAGGYARSNIKQDDGDTSQAKTGYGVVYASLGKKDWFGDINIAAGRSDINDESGTSFGTQADYKASNYALYLGGGKEIRSRSDLFSFTPKASLLLSDYYQNAYTEELDSGVAREVPAYERTSIRSSLGAVVAMQKEYDIIILRPEARLRWLHEFNSDVEQINFTLAEGMGGQYYSLMPAAEEDVLEVGAGLTCAFHDALSLALDLDWRIGEDYNAYSVSGRAIFEF